MNIQDIIGKKRDGKKLTTEEINYFVEAYTKRRDCRLSGVCFDYGNIY